MLVNDLLDLLLLFQGESAPDDHASWFWVERGQQCADGLWAVVFEIHDGGIGEMRGEARGHLDGEVAVAPDAEEGYGGVGLRHGGVAASVANRGIMSLFSDTVVQFY